MIDGMFQDSTDKVLDDLVARPIAPPPAKPSFGTSVWNTTKAPFTGVVAGANESIAFGSDILGAFGATQAAYGLQADPSLLFSPEKQKERIAAGQQSRDEIASGEAFSTELGTDLRTTARSLMPDPETSNLAENLLFGFSRFATKAVGYSVAAGPIIGATLTGADEGMTEADKLKAEGVDIGTRTQVGVAAGLSAAAATALPVAGKTIAQTVGLVAAGGPGAFIAQQAASRSILQNAGYDKIAEQYDPFDPVGLAVSTLVPAGFGAYAARGMRGAKPVAAPMDPAASRELVSMGRNERVALRYDDARLDAYTVTAAQREGVPADLLIALKNAGEKSAPTATSPKGAHGVAQLMPENQRKYGVKDPSDPIQSIDGMAQYIRDTLKQYDGNIQAVIADYNGGPRQAKRVVAGMAPQAIETIKYLKRVNEYMAERQGTEAGRAAANDPEAVAAARVQLVRDTVQSWNLKDPSDIAGAEQHLNAFSRVADQIGAGERVSVGDTITLDNLTQARMLEDFGARLEQARADLLPDVANAADPGVIRTMRDQIAELQQSRPAATDEALRTLAKQVQADQGISYKEALSAARKDVGDRIADIDNRVEALQNQVDRHGESVQAADQVRQLDEQIAQIKADRAEIGAPTPKRSALAVKQAVADLGSAKVGTKPAATDARVSGTNTAKSGTEPANPATKAPESGTQAGNMGTVLEAQTAEIARLTPDLLVQLEGMDKPMRLSDALEQVKAEAAKDVQEAGLLKVAAECFLRNG